MNFTSLPFGDGWTTTGFTGDIFHYAELDTDVESGTDHAQFRQYNQTQGRWMSPDPYSGSYDMSNPQTFNRYAYVMDAPLAFVDPTGQNEGGGFCSNILNCIVAAAGAIFELDSLLGGSNFHGTLTPRPNSDPWSERDAATGITSLGVPPSALASPQGALGSINQAIGLPSGGCEFGACGAGPSSLTPGQAAQLSAPILFTPPQWLLSFVAQFTTATGNALHASPLKVNSGVCSIYGDQPYLGAGLQCVCQSAGDGPWSQDTRGSLATDQKAGINEYIAHGTSYVGSTVRTQSFPAITLGKSYMSCKRW
jgi:RHS repeat-associated protein